MATYKLTYFDVRARGEIPRTILKLGKQPFEDIRVDPADWPQYKLKTPLGHLPTLETEGVVLSQSNAINRYLAKKLGLAGKSDLEQAWADMIVDTMETVYEGVDDVLLPGQENRAAVTIVQGAMSKYADHVDTVLQKIEKLLEQNNGGQGFFVGDGVTWADVVVYSIVAFTDQITEGDRWAKCPKLQAFKTRFESIPQIAEHLRTRPDAPF